MHVSKIDVQQFKGTDLNNIPKEDVKQRLRELNSDAPIIYTTSLIKAPQEITLRAVARNNIMLEQILQNQNKILENQNKILGLKLSVNA